MRKLALASAIAAAALITAAAPASADVFVGADESGAGVDESGAGVQVGPFGVGVGPRFSWHDRYYGDDGYRAYGAAHCRVIREKIVTPHGNVINVIYERRRHCY
jgi:hypothetical protein